MKKLKILALQLDLVWENPEANIRQIEESIKSHSDSPDLILLPEMFSTGFSMNPADHSEKMDGKTVRWMQETAIKNGAAICGSLIIEVDAQYYNRLLWVHPDGTLEHYDKRHLFGYAGEDRVYTAGQSRKVVEFKGWRFLLQVCYDLRFPVFSRYQNDYDVILYPANWPDKRAFAWSNLLRARAIENISFVIGVNRVGKDGNGIDHSGRSVVLSPLGETLADAIDFEAGPMAVELNKESLDDTRSRFRFLDDRDRFKLL